MKSRESPVIETFLSLKGDKMSSLSSYEENYMKRAALLILLIFLSGTIVAQQEKKTPPADDKGKKSTSIPEGYGSLTWGTMLSDAKAKIVGRLFFTDEKKIIISRDGDLEYRYGFLYIDPAAAPGAEKKSDEKEEKTNDETKKDEGKLFYVSLQFPYLTMTEVMKKMKDKYGEATSSNIKDNQGAMAWDSEKTIVVIWIDRYEKKPFCRRITYLSKDIAKELNTYVEQVFNRAEIELIKQLNP